MKNILNENLSFDQASMIVEAADENGADGKKKLYMSGIFIMGGVKNHNGRNYPVSEIREAVEEVNKQIGDGFSVCGEADHPTELNINLDRISHVITKMWMDGPNGYGKLKILPTPMGNIVRTLVESDVKLGVSSRGSGNVDEAGYVSDFSIVTVDVVMKPSAPNAYPTPVFEAVARSRRAPVLADLAEAVRHDPKAQKHFHREVLNLIEALQPARR